MILDVRLNAVKHFVRSLMSDLVTYIPSEPSRTRCTAALVGRLFRLRIIHPETDSNPAPAFLHPVVDKVAGLTAGTDYRLLHRAETKSRHRKGASSTQQATKLLETETVHA